MQGSGAPGKFVMRRSQTSDARRGEFFDFCFGLRGEVMDVTKPYEFIGLGPWMSPNRVNS